MKRSATIISILIVFLFCASGRGLADDASEANSIVDQAETTLKNFLEDPDMRWFASHLQGAKGILIVPRRTKGAFLFGLEGGNGVVLVRDEQTDTWTEPVFYETSAVSFGLQAGVDIQEAIVLIKTRKAVDSLMAGRLTLGVAGAVAIGPRGMGASTNLMTNFVTFTRAKGLYAGVSFDGASIRTRDDLNAFYYGEDVRPSDIVIARKPKPNPNSKELHAMLAMANVKQ